MRNCIVPFCKNRGSIAGLTYFRVTENRRERWLRAIGRRLDDNLSTESSICSDHFKPEDFEIKENRQVLKSSAVPSQKLRPVDIRKQVFIQRFSKPHSEVPKNDRRTEPILDDFFKSTFQPPLTSQNSNLIEQCSTSQDSNLDEPRRNSTAVQRSLPVYDKPVHNIAHIQNSNVASIDPQTAGKRYRVCDIHFSNFCRSPGTKILKFGNFPTLYMPDFKDVPTEQNSLYDENRTVQEGPPSEIKNEVEDIIEELQTDTTIISMSPKENMLETTSSTSTMSNSSNAYIPKVTTENLNWDVLSEHLYATVPPTSSQSNTSDNTVATNIYPSSALEPNRCDSSSSDEDNYDNQMIETPVEKDKTTVAKNTDIDISIDRFNKICRMCFSEKEIKPLFKLLFEGVQFYEIYREITGLQIQNEDNLPHHICLSCIEKVIELYLFIQKCYKSEEKLHNIWRKVAVNMTTVNPEINANFERDSEHEQNISEGSDFNVDNTTKIEDISLQSALTSLTNNVPEYKADSKRIEITKSVQMKFVRNFNKLQPIKKSVKISGPPYVCEKCNNSYDDIFEFRRHYKKSSKCRLCVYSCKVCDRKFISGTRLKSHMLTHTKEKPHMCDICGSRFSLSCNLVRHKRRHTGERLFSCETCGKSFTTKLSKIEHMRLHTGEKPYVCSYCEMRFVSSSRLTTHTKKHAKGKQITTRNRCNYKSCLCSTCGKIFGSPVQLRTHSVMHTGIKPYSCEICKKSFPYSSSLKVHSVVHNGERAHLCTICNKSFNQRAHLQMHIKTHLGEKPYACQFCGKRFTFSGNLTVHKRLHTGETPYHCPVCNKGFPHSSSMKKHAKIHNKNVKKL